MPALPSPVRTPLSRRPLLAAAGAALVLNSRGGHGQDAGGFPSRRVELIVPFAAGATIDALSRLVGAGLERRWGQSVVVENRTGAGGNLGAGQVAKAEPDGHTLLVGSAGLMTVNPHIYDDLTFDIARDLTPVAMLATVPNVLTVPAGSEARTVEAFVGLAREGGRPVLYGSPGGGSYAHVTGALFARETGLEAEHVPYRGSAPALVDLVAGRIDMMLDNLPGVLAMIRDGRLRALAVTAEARIPALPDVPTMAEAGVPAVQATAWFALFAPAGASPELVRRIAADVAAVLAEPATAGRVAELGFSIGELGPELLGEMVVSERARWGALVEEAGIRVD